MNAQLEDDEVCRRCTNSAYLDTPLGSIIAVADEAGLYLLAFADSQDLKLKIKKIQIKTKSSITSGMNLMIQSIFDELKSYFSGQLKNFKTPIHCFGSSFQQQSWSALQQIPYGETISYAEQAQKIGRSKAYRAVAQANSTNPLVMIIPCHRVINRNGNLGGYSPGLERKQWLLAHERKYVTKS